MTAYLLDTCAAIWLAQGDGLAVEAQEALRQSLSRGKDIHVSPITAWEIGQLNAKGRLSLRQPPVAWFRRLMSPDGMRLASLDPDTLIASSFLPGSPPRDPADRIIAATAREQGFTLMTRDRLLLAYAEAGHLDAVAC